MAPDTRFQQNHAIVRISGKTVGHYAAGRAAANDQMGRNRIRLSFLSHCIMFHRQEDCLIMEVNRLYLALEQIIK
jgi:hypothetical protein